MKDVLAKMIGDNIDDSEGSEVWVFANRRGCLRESPQAIPLPGGLRDKPKGEFANALSQHEVMVCLREGCVGRLERRRRAEEEDQSAGGNTSFSHSLRVISTPPFLHPL
eukprot:2062113-Pyramimonas_sp.AAC.1